MQHNRGFSVLEPENILYQECLQRIGTEIFTILGRGFYHIRTETFSVSEQMEDFCITAEGVSVLEYEFIPSQNRGFYRKI